MIVTAAPHAQAGGYEAMKVVVVADPRRVSGGL